MRHPTSSRATSIAKRWRGFVRMRIRAIQSCYEKRAQAQPVAQGSKVGGALHITTQGRSSEIELEEDTMHNDAVGSCIKAIIRGWTFPFKPESDVPVAYPVRVHPVELSGNLKSSAWSVHVHAP